MSILSQRTNVPPTYGQRIVICGTEGMGKTTLACDAPGALLIPTEQGFASQSCDRVPIIEWWEHLESLCGELIAGAQDGSIARGTSVVWDSATAIERLAHSRVLRTDPAWRDGNPSAITMTSAHGGYGKAYNVATELFGKWLGWMDQLSMLGIHQIITCHVFAADVIDPAFGEYAQWDILLHSPKNQKTYGAREMITQWADMVGFLHTPLFVTKGTDATIAKGVDQGKGRVLAVERDPSWVAKNRYNLNAGIQVPVEGGWNHVAAAIYEGSKQKIDVFKR